MNTPEPVGARPGDAVSDFLPAAQAGVPSAVRSHHRWPPALLNRFPRLRVRTESTLVVPVEVRSAYPALHGDFAVLDEVVGPSFAMADRAALIEQNRYRLFQVLILFGSAVLSGSAALQGVFPDQRWPGIVSAVLGLLLATVGQTAGELGTLTEFQTSRMKAERLRALHFQFLSRAGRFGGPDRDTALRRAVIAIEAGKEPT